MNYTDVFGNTTVPPSQSSYETQTLVTNTQAYWPDNYTGTGLVVSTVTEVVASSTYTLTMPPANQVSVGRDVLLRNRGFYAISVNKYDGSSLTTLSPGASVLLYVTDNSGSAGTWGQILYGVGTAEVHAASLVGYGIKAIGATLNQSHPVLTTQDTVTVTATDRARFIVFTGGTGTINLPSATSIGDDFFFLLRNSGTGSLTIDPNGSETVDDLSSLVISPGESTILCSSGVEWFSIGYGRPTEFNFTQLTKDVSAGGTITLTDSEVANKLLTFTGSPSGAVTVVVPATVQVYYAYNNISNPYSVTIKTASGSGVAIPQTQRIICFCDSVNVVSAQSAIATAAVALTDGDVTNPSLNFASQTNTGLYKYGVSGLGVTIGGVLAAFFDSSGLNVSGNLTVGGSLILTDPMPLAGAANKALGTALSEYVTKSSNYTVVEADRGRVFDCTSSLTLSLTAAATLGNGFTFAVRTRSSVTVIIDPYSTELINGNSSFTITDNQSYLFTSTGTGWVSINLPTAALNVVSQQQTATDGQTVISVPWTYVPGSGQLRFYLNGLLQEPGDAYTETSSNQITCSESLVTGDQILLMFNDTTDPDITNAASLAAQLATAGENSGADLIGFLQSGTGAVTRDAQSKLREVVSVKDFGAVGDGVTDDTDAIQAAIDSGAAVIFYPAGTYKITRGTGTQEMPAYPGTFVSNSGLYPRSNQRHVGYGATMAAYDSLCNIFSNAIVDFNYFSDYILENITFEGFEFDLRASFLADPETVSGRPQAGDNFNMGVYIWNGQNITVKNCSFKDAWYCGVVLFCSKNGTVENCTFENIGKPTAAFPNYFAMRFDGGYGSTNVPPCSGIKIRRNTFTNCGGGIASNSGLNNAGVPPGFSENHLIQGNEIESCVSGIDLSNGRYKNVTIDGNTLRSLTGTRGGIYCLGNAANKDSYSNNIRIVNNSILNAFDFAISSSCVGIFISTSGSNYVQNNYIQITGSSVAFVRGIEGQPSSSGVGTFYQGKSLVISGNTIDAADYLYGVSLQYVDRAMITNNTFNRTARNKDINTLSTVQKAVAVGNSFLGGPTASIKSINLVNAHSAGANTYRAGLASVANGGTVAHGLDEAPALVLANIRASANSYIVNATADATNITFSIYDTAGVAVTSPQSVSWFALTWAEIEYLP